MKTVKQGKVATANGEDSDDSLIGDHSPFLVTTKSRCVILTIVGFVSS